MTGQRRVLEPEALDELGSEPVDAEDEKGAYRRGYAIEAQEQISKHRRDERGRAILSWGMHSLMIVVIAAMAVVVVVVALHHLAPVGMRWLAEDELPGLRIFLFSGAITSVVTAYVQRVQTNG